jgi:hypothetical protein
MTDNQGTQVKLLPNSPSKRCILFQQPTNWDTRKTPPQRNITGREGLVNRRDLPVGSHPMNVVWS